MKNNLLIVGLLATGFAFGQTTDNTLPPEPKEGESRCYVKCVTPDVWKNEDVKVLERAEYTKYSKVYAKYETKSEKVLIQEASKKFVNVPATYETKTVSYVGKEADNSFSVINAKISSRNETVEVKPSFSQWEYSTYPNCSSPNPGDCKYVCWKEYPAKFKTIRLYDVKDATKSSKPIPVVNKSYTKRVIKTPASTKEIAIPAVYKTIYTQKLVSPAKVTETKIPAKYKTYTKRVLAKKGGVTVWEEVECTKISGEILPIYYNLGSAALTSASKKIIDTKLYSYMKSNPNQVIEISSHTDSRGDDASNMDLSQRRAQSVVDYLLAKGIDASRLMSKGYGETMLKNHCSNGKSCTESQHRMNRRTEFRVVSK